MLARRRVVWFNRHGMTMTPPLAPLGARYFKFICGANLRDTDRVETLATVFGLAGASLFDVAAEPQVVAAAWRGIEKAKALLADAPDWLRQAYGDRPLAPIDPQVMVSITLSGDRHTQIAVVEQDICTRCDLCTSVCPPGAIVNGDVETRICTGCMLCVPVCPPICIEMAPRETDPDLDACWEAGARALEIHTGAADPAEVAAYRPLAANWQSRGGMLAYSIDGKQLGFPRAIALAQQVGGPGVIIQADGKPISGTVGDKSTIPALRLARAMIRAGVPGLIQPAGGTNDRTGPLAERHGIGIHGVGMGSFARRVAKPLEEGDLSDKAWLTAVTQALRLVESIQPGVRPENITLSRV
jgi:Pyruvate/2-oxoacid:ferredoxin oxidoreductase delta subunit